MKLEGLTDNEKDARIAELEADLAHCRHTRRLQADARQKERAKLDSLQAQYEDMKQERDMFAEKLAEAEKDRERLKREVARLNDDVFSMSLIGAAREGE